MSPFNRFIIEGAAIAVGAATDKKTTWAKVNSSFLKTKNKIIEKTKVNSGMNI